MMATAAAAPPPDRDTDHIRLCCSTSASGAGLGGRACGQVAGGSAEMKCLIAAMTSAACSACGL
jgi:hypothetical protein